MGLELPIQSIVCLNGQWNSRKKRRKRRRKKIYIPNTESLSANMLMDFFIVINFLCYLQIVYLLITVRYNIKIKMQIKVGLSIILQQYSEVKYMSLITQYIWGMIPYCFIGAIVSTIFRALYLKKTKTKMVLKREVMIILFAAYGAGLVSQTIMPDWDTGIDSGTGQLYFDIYLENNLSSVNLIPFKTISNEIIGNNSHIAYSDIQSVTILNIFANLLLFSPIGIFLPILSEYFRKVSHIIMVGIMISTFVEIFQYFIGRSSDIDDMILNTVGVCIGFLIYKCLVYLFFQKE